MKILFCVLCLSYGGAEKNLLFVANNLSRRGHEVVICNMNYLPTVQKPDAQVRVIDMPHYVGKTKRYKQLRYLQSLCRKEKPDLLISFLTMPNMLTSIVGRLTGIPAIISERGDPYQNTSRIMRMIYSTYNLAKGAVFQTDGAKGYFSKGLRKRGTVIPNPVIMKADAVPANYEACEKSIAYVARFEVKQKRQDVMLRAFALVNEKFPEYRLDFYGDGPDEPAMKELTEELGLTDNVVFHGLSNTVHKELAKSELFVLSSDYEGIPNALIEAMSIGLPCVSTDCSPGGARMLIKHEENGILVKCGDPEALAEGICRFLSDRAFAIQCGQNATAIQQRFLPEKIVDAWEDYCVKVVAKKHECEKMGSR